MTKTMTLLVLVLWTCSAIARGTTGEEDALEANEFRRAPLTLSADGRWRLHVGPDGVLHRVLLTGTRPAQQFTLPKPALVLSASRSGQRVAFTVGSACVGLVDFGSGPTAAPALTWWPSDPSPPGAQRGCDEGVALGRQPIALSPDGRWLATPWHVIDTQTRQTVATLPPTERTIGARHPVHLQFVDNGRKLFIVTATLGEGYESLSRPSNLQFAVWDMSSKSLHRLLSVEDDRLFFPQGFFFDHSPATGALYWVDSRRHMAARPQGKTDEELPPLELVQSWLTACKPVVVPRFQLPIWGWHSLLVDPHGRWVAAMRPLSNEPSAGRGNSGFVEELIVFDLDSRRPVVQRAFKSALLGLVALPDGSALFGLTQQPLDPRTALPLAGNGGGELVQVDIDVAQLKTPRLAPMAWEGACPIEDEVPGARQVQPQTAVARLVWTIEDLKPLSELRMQAEPSTSPQPVPCLESSQRLAFLMQDGTLWLDRYAEIVQLDPASGRALRSLPTPRRSGLCSLVAPAANGFVNYQGDTLSWRPFEGSAARRMLELIPGWHVQDVQLDEAGRLTSTWRTKPGTQPKASKDGVVLDMRLVAHDAASLRRLGEQQSDSDSVDMGVAWGLPPIAPCERAAEAPAQQHDWRVSHFDSFRAYACEGTGKRTVFWSHLDISPRSTTPTDSAPRRAWAVAHGVAVAQDGLVLHVFELTTRRELKRVMLTPAEGVLDVQLLPAQGMLIVHLRDATQEGHGRQLLRMYAYR
jgi:hypothetical protein